MNKGYLDKYHPVVHTENYLGGCLEIKKTGVLTYVGILTVDGVEFYASIRELELTDRVLWLLKQRIIQAIKRDATNWNIELAGKELEKAQERVRVARSINYEN